MQIRGKGLPGRGILGLFMYDPVQGIVIIPCIAEQQGKISPVDDLGEDIVPLLQDRGAEDQQDHGDGPKNSGPACEKAKKKE